MENINTMNTADVTEQVGPVVPTIDEDWLTSAVLDPYLPIGAEYVFDYVRQNMDKLEAILRWNIYQICCEAVEEGEIVLADKDDECMFEERTQYMRKAEQKYGENNLMCDEEELLDAVHRLAKLLGL